MWLRNQELCRTNYLDLVLFLFFFPFLFIFLAMLGPRCYAGFLLVAASGGYSSLWCIGFSLRWLLLFQSMGSRHEGFSSCGTWAQQLWLAGSRAQAQQLWHTGLVALQHVGSSPTRARTRVPCIGRRILNHCATREAPQTQFFIWLIIGIVINLHVGNSLVVQQLRLWASFHCRETGSIPAWGTKIPHAARRGRRKKHTKKNLHVNINRN